MNTIEKHWFLIVNIIAFVIALFDGFIWRNEATGFPICTILGCCIASIVGCIYKVIQAFKKIKEQSLVLNFSGFLLLCFGIPFYGVLGGIFGLIIGFMLIK